MGGGRDKQAENQQRQLAQQQYQQSQELYNFAKQRTAQMDKLQAPAINYATGMASGDPEKMAWAASVPIGNITKSYRASRENIYDSVPSGAARDFALAMNEKGRTAATGTAMNQGFFEALNTLMQAGGAQGQFGLQQMGAGLRAGEASGSTANSLIQAGNQRKAAQMGLLGNIAGAAGSAAGGYFGR